MMEDSKYKFNKNLYFHSSFDELQIIPHSIEFERNLAITGSSKTERGYDQLK